MHTSHLIFKQAILVSSQCLRETLVNKFVLKDLQQAMTLARGGARACTSGIADSTHILTSETPLQRR